MSINTTTNEQCDLFVVLVPHGEVVAEVYLYATPRRSREDYIFSHDHVERVQFKEARLAQPLGRAPSSISSS